MCYRHLHHARLSRALQDFSKIFSTGHSGPFGDLIRSLVLRKDNGPPSNLIRYGAVRTNPERQVEQGELENSLKVSEFLPLSVERVLRWSRR